MLTRADKARLATHLLDGLLPAGRSVWNDVVHNPECDTQGFRFYATSCVCRTAPHIRESTKTLGPRISITPNRIR